MAASNNQPQIPNQNDSTSHLYDGKTVRAAAPSRKKAAGSLKSTTEIPKDAIPEVQIPSFVESLLGGPIVPKIKFLPADKMVKNLQLSSYGVLLILTFLTFLTTPSSGTIWQTILGTGVITNSMHLLVLTSAGLIGLYSIKIRDPRWMLASYILFIFFGLRFASSQVTLAWGGGDGDVFDLDKNTWMEMFLVVLYAVSLVMYLELTNSIIRFSMLDTSIKTNEVYVMNVKNIVKKYYRSIFINPTVAAILAALVLSINTIIPFFINWFSSETALRMENSVELISVYGVAIGSLIVFAIVGLLFAINLPLRIQKYRENNNSEKSDS
ncbi:MAG: hypothetical protein CMB64_01780 [Euryarchaeota archaeon]|nr:hypothetical protein [Euryarchaeota archaeon]